MSSQQDRFAAGDGGQGGGSNGQRPGAPGDPRTPPGDLQKGRRQMMTWMMLLMLGMLIWVVLSTSSGDGRKLTSIQEFLGYVQSGRIVDKSIVLHQNKMVGEIKPGTIGFETAGDNPTPVYVGLLPAEPDWIRGKLTELHADWSEAEGSSFFEQFILAVGPVLLLILALWWVFSRSMRAAGGGPGGMLGSFGKSRHKITGKEHVEIRFTDVAGIDEAKDEVQEIVEFLRNPKRFTKIGARIPRGVLLSGPPGCGKTLLAKAIAGEADVPFFSISGSDFVEMFVGVGASRVRDLFKQAKENSPCIIFLDEIDAVGRRRGGGSTTGGHDEREQTLNAILVEMDGFDANQQVIIIAATNRPDVLDPALIRPGRFDRQVVVQLPDIAGRKQILGVHAKKIKVGTDVDLERLAKGTPMFSGAELAALINEAALIAGMASKDFVEMADLEEARDKVRWGRANRSKQFERDERELVAFHEAGHAILQVLVPHADPLHKVTIIPRGQALGASMWLPDKDRAGQSRRYLEARMRVACGGRIAEERHTGDISSGAAGDIQGATEIARAMVLQFGMSNRLGFVRYVDDGSQESFVTERAYSPETAHVIDEEIRRLIDESYKDAKRIIDDHWPKVEAIAKALLVYETLNADEVHRLIKGEPLTRPTVADLLTKELAEGSKPPAGPATVANRADDAPPDALPLPA
ncbi:MAG: ATP-dependent zinc metalloprotease FtsH [Planctomycetota bacterium]|nr:ATP-dependent zinc metalloprotease FtsH [Planctomycetota bacterium]MDA1105543.1 ATP-dependent zinc metalloprotease FtsH [Planctomycetota bacterium]